MILIRFVRDRHTHSPDRHGGRSLQGGAAHRKAACREAGRLTDSLMPGRKLVPVSLPSRSGRQPSGAFLINRLVLSGNLATGECAKGLERLAVNIFAEELHASIAEQELRPADMHAAETPVG